MQIHISHTYRYHPLTTRAKEIIKMPTAPWSGFLHSWHVLGIVLKWMCITVVGIPFAFAICLFVTLCVIAFVLLCLAAVFIAFLAVPLFLKALWCLLTRWPYWISNFRIWRAERALLRGLPPPVTASNDFPMAQWTQTVLGPRKPLQEIPITHLTTPLKIPTRLHIAEQYTSSLDPAVPLSELPGMVECKICTEEKLPSMFPPRPPTDSCVHAKDNCCRTCLAQTIIAAFEGNMWDDIRCPMCNIQLEHRDVAEFAPPDIFERFVYVLLFL